MTDQCDWERVSKPRETGYTAQLALEQAGWIAEIRSIRHNSYGMVWQWFLLARPSPEGVMWVHRVEISLRDHPGTKEEINAKLESMLEKGWARMLSNILNRVVPDLLTKTLEERARAE